MTCRGYTAPEGAEQTGVGCLGLLLVLQDAFPRDVHCDALLEFKVVVSNGLGLLFVVC